MGRKMKVYGIYTYDDCHTYGIGVDAPGDYKEKLLTKADLIHAEHVAKLIES